MIRIRYEPTGDTVVARAGETVMERLHALGAPIESACRGNGACGTCVVWVEEGGEQIDPAGEAETALLRRREGVSRARLSCQARVRDGADGTLRVRLPAQRLGRLEADRRARIFRRVYLDHLALTGVTDGARRAVQEALGRAVGEPGGSHAASARAREAAREVRGSIAAALGVGEGSVRLHRSRREAVVALLLGSWSPDAGRIAQDAGRTLPDEILLGPWEDPEIPSIASGARPLRVRVLVPDGRGIVTPDAIRSAIGPRTRCVFLSRADRYLGIVQPVEDLVAACGEVPLIVDTTRAAGRCAPAPWGGLAAQIVGPESVGGPSGVAVVVLGEGRSIVPPWPLDLALARDEELVVPASGFAEALRERWAASEGGVRPLA
ncbi:MAG: aminotransferase class V-fold PLP-dependent enzyme, partial [Planctomycetes bacterium]|nr:aminotransferase class V-fold PLP-dependent enzyme [Planctomycetota bacterium]